MAINTNPSAPVRQLATFNSSGNFAVPAGLTSVFVSIHSATGGGGGANGPMGGRYSGNAGPGTPGASGGSGVVSGAWVQVAPGASYAIAIGAAGAAGAGQPGHNQGGNPGAAGGTTSFDVSALSVVGSGGGSGGGSNNPGSAASSSGITNLSSLSPTTNAVTRTGPITNQATGAFASGTGGQSTAAPGNAGTAGQVHIYG